MQQDQADDEGSIFDDIPSFAEAVKERKEHIAQLREEGDHERAGLLAKCRKRNRCYLDDCAVCRRRHAIALSKVPESVLHSITSTRSSLRFVAYDLDVNAIKVKCPRRPLDEKKLRALKASIALIGLQTPITVRMIHKNKYELVTGLYRLVAMKELGEKYIPCYEHYCEESESYLWKRSENIYRAEARVLERAEAIDEMRQAILQKGGRVAPPGGRQPEEAGIKKAAKTLGFTREEVRRSKAIAQISPEAKAEARKLGLDDNQHALLEIAKLPANAQCAAVKATVERQRAAHARLASRAAVVGNNKAAAKITAIEAKITKKEDTLKSLKEELAHERDRLHTVQDEVVAACVSNALISDPSAQLADEGSTQAVLDEPLSPEDEASFAAVVEKWNKARELKAELADASPIVLERYIAMVRAWAAQEYKKSKEAKESDSA